MWEAILIYTNKNKMSVAKLMFPKFSWLKIQFKIGLFEIYLFIPSVSAKSLSYLVAIYWAPLIWRHISCEGYKYEFKAVKDINMSKS